MNLNYAVQYVHMHEKDREIMKSVSESERAYHISS